MRIVDTVKYSPEAREAGERYGINPFRVPVTEESAQANNEIFLGLVFSSGGEEFVIPQFDRGLPVEYELTRSIRVVSRAKRKKVGVLQTGASLFGGFDFQRRANTNEWSIVRDAISGIRNDLPVEMKEPLQRRFDPNDLPIDSLVLSSTRLSPAELTLLADPDITRELRAVGGVAQVNLVGGVNREISVDLRPEDLAAAGVSVAQVVAAVEAQNLAAPVGGPDHAASDAFPLWLTIPWENKRMLYRHSLRLAVLSLLSLSPALPLRADPVSAFGGIVAFNRPLDAAAAEAASAIFTEVRPPPAYGTIGSSTPWNAMTGTGAPVQGWLYSTPAMGAIAVMRSGSRHASSDDIWAPFDSKYPGRAFLAARKRVGS